MSASNTNGFIWKRRIEFCETDAAGIAHFSTFLLIMEQSEHALFRSLGMTVFPRSAFYGLPRREQSDSAQSFSPRMDGADLHSVDLHSVTWPRVRCEVDYVSPARFEDELEDCVRVERLGEKSVTFVHRLARGSHLVANGKMISVCSIKDPDSGHLIGHVIPDPIRSLLARFLITADARP